MSVTHHLNTHFSRAALAYDIHALLQQQIARGAYVKADSLFNEGSVLLDLGCGTGGFSRYEGGYARVINYDLAYGMCVQAGNGVNGDMTSLPFASECVDGVFSSLALQWVESKQDAFVEMFRVLAGQGHVLFTSFCEGTLHEFHDALHAVDASRSVHVFDDVYKYKSLLEGAGFVDVEFTVETIKESVADSMTLMRQMKAIGAQNKETTVVPSKDFFTQVEAAYRKRWENPTGTLPVTWNVVTMWGKKP